MLITVKNWWDACGIDKKNNKDDAKSNSSLLFAVKFFNKQNK